MCFHPVGDGDVDFSFTRPRLIIHRLNNRPRLHDVVKSPSRDSLLRMFCVPTIQRGQPQIIRDARRQIVSGFAKPIHTEVRHLRHAWKDGVNLSHVFVAMFLGEES